MRALATAACSICRSNGLLTSSSQMRAVTSKVFVDQHTRQFRTTPVARQRDRRANLLRASAATEAHGRLSADGVSLDAQLVAKHPELVLSNLKARRSGEDSVAAVAAIGGTQRLALQLEQFVARTHAHYIAAEKFSVNSMKPCSAAHYMICLSFERGWQSESLH